MHVPFLDLKGQQDRLRDALDAAIRSVVDEAAYIGGSVVAEFQGELAAFMETRHARGVANCTAALRLVLRALPLEPGDEVITTVHTAIATAEAITLAGARPVFADIDPETWVLDVDHAASLVGPRTRAIIPVHLYGMAAPMDRVTDMARRHDLTLIEDVAQAQGARFRGRRAGGWGWAGCLSFFPSKNLGGFGDGGAVVTDDGDLARFVTMFSNHGRLEKYTHEMQGTNERLDALQAAVLRVKLRVLDEWNARRRRVAEWYAEELDPVSEVRRQRVVDGAEPVWHLYVIEVDDRDGLADHLQRQGIGSGLHYPLPLHLQPAFAWMERGAGSFPAAERLCSRCLSLPMDPFLTREQVHAVGEAVRAFVRPLAPTR